jgi:hypothetical protein
MNGKMILWLGALALTAAPAVTVMAQEGPDENGPEAAMSEEAPARPDAPGGLQQAQAAKGRPGMAGKRFGRMGEMEGPRPGMGGPVLLSDEEALAVITRNDPDFAKKMADLKTVSPAKYRMLMMMSRRVLSFANMEKDAAMEKDAVRGLSLEFQTKELALDYGRAADADKKAIKENLRAKLAELFDLKSKGQEMRVKHMEAEISKLKKNLEDRKVNKAKIVDQRLDEMTGEGLGW